MSEEGLQIAERREAKGKEKKKKKKTYNHLKAGFQRIAGRDKKAFLSDQCKKIEEKIKWKRLEISSKKIRASKGTFHAKMGTIKDRNDTDLTETE